MSFFRETLTVLAALLLLVLTAALAGPYFVDWTAHRGWVEEVLSDALGSKVEVAGAIDVRLLPAPAIDLAKVSWVGARPGDPRLVADRMRLEMSATPLMRGAVRFVEATIERPRVTLTLGEDGSVALPRPPAHAPEEVAFERIEVRGGAVEIVRPGGPRILLDNVGAQAEAVSLYGPFKGAGKLTVGDEDVSFRVNTAAVEGQRLRFKTIVEGLGVAPHLEFDGALVATPDGVATRMSLDGALVVSGALDADGATIPWRATGAVVANADHVQVDPLDLRFGGDERQMSATGSATYVSSVHAISLRLASPQVNFDRLLSEEDPQAAMQRAVQIAGAYLSRPARQRKLALEVEASAPAVQIGGDTLTEASVRFSAGPESEGVLNVEANLPGRSRLSMVGALESGAAARFSGRVDVSTRDLPRIADWAALADSDFAERLRGLPFRRLELAGQVDISRASFSGRGLTIKADRSTFTGALAFARSVGDEPARLFADLSSPSLDLDGLPDLSGPARAAADMDLNLALDARAVRLARFGDGMVDAGRIRAKLRRASGVLELERLSIENVGGATLSASGRTTGDGARLDVRLDAQRLVDLAALVNRVWPGQVAQEFASRAVALSPARVSFQAEAQARDDSYELRNLRLDGLARGTRIAGSMRPAGEKLEAEIELTSADTPMLMRQLGFDTAPLPGAPRSRITARGSGALSTGFQGSVVADLAGVRIAYEGGVRVEGRQLAGTGGLKATTSDAGPLLAILSVAAPNVEAAAPVDLSAAVTVNRGRLSLDDIAGVIAGSKATGALRMERREDRGRFALMGALALDRASISALASFALGPAGPRREGALWSDAKFGYGLSDPPPTLIDLKIEQFALRGGLVGHDAKLKLGLDAGLVALDDLSMRVGESRITGRTALRRNKADASLSARLDFQTTLENRPDLSGRLNARLNLAATGTSEASLMANLAGGGEARLADVVIHNADPAALERVVAAAESDKLTSQENVIVLALEREFAKAPLRAPELGFDVVVAGGVARLQPAPISAPGVAIGATASLDLRDQKLEETLEFTSLKPPAGWTGAPPQARIVWSGPVGAPNREVLAAGLVNGLSARAILRETARIEALEADIRERAYFNRRLKAQEWLRQREAEIEAWKIEEARRIEAEKAAEAKRIAEEKAAEARRIEAEKAEEAKRIEAEKRAAEAARRKAAEEERRKAAEAARRKAAEAARQERERSEQALRELLEREARERNAAQRPLSILPPPAPLLQR